MKYLIPMIAVCLLLGCETQQEADAGEFEFFEQAVQVDNAEVLYNQVAFFEATEVEAAPCGQEVQAVSCSAVQAAACQRRTPIRTLLRRGLFPRARACLRARLRGC